MEKKIRLTYLYDFYGQMLTENQQSVMQEYIEDDLTISEIASGRNISRQAASDMIKRTTRALEDYESTLHLVSRFLMLRDQVVEMKSVTDGYKDRLPLDFCRELDAFFENVLEDF